MQGRKQRTTMPISSTGQKSHRSRWLDMSKPKPYKGNMKPSLPSLTPQPQNTKGTGKIQKKLSTFLTQSVSFTHSEIRDIQTNFMRYEAHIATLLNESRDIRKKAEPLPTPPVVETIRPTVNSSLRLELPDFTGHPLDWHHFFEFFITALERAGTGFSDREKSCFLLKAMRDIEAEQIVRSYSTSKDGYQEALRALSLRYGATKKVFPHLVRKMTSKAAITFTQEGFVKFREQYLRPLQSMEELECTSISQFAACLALENLDHRLREEWTKSYKSSSEVPTLKDLAMFLEPLENNLQALSLTESHPSQHVTSRRPSAPNSRPFNSNCSICQEPHRLNRCPTFLGYDISKRNKVARDKRLCINCLTSGHRSHECKSSYTCRECHGKPHSLLHRAPNPPTLPATTTTTNLMAVERSGTESTLIAA